jgi:site-specific DNA-adenine methylase
MTHEIINHPRFLHSYVGSKRRWLPALRSIAEQKPIAELFAGSAAISAAYASSALIVDTDEDVTRVLRQFDELIVPDEFTVEDYNRVRRTEDWWLYSYYLSAMSFGGSWRSSKKGGWNLIPRNQKTYALRDSYDRALTRWRELSPDVRTSSYLDITDEEIENVRGYSTLVVLDPPYENTAAQYNTKTFDYAAYWDRVQSLASRFDVLLFDKASNLQRAGYEVEGVQTMSGIGTKKADAEGMSFLKRKVVEKLLIMVVNALVRMLVG